MSQQLPERRTPSLDGRSDAVAVRQQLIALPIGWVQHWVFVHDGEAFEYMFELLPGNATERQAKAKAEKLNTAKKAQGAFLRDVATTKERTH